MLLCGFKFLFITNLDLFFKSKYAWANLYEKALGKRLNQRRSLVELIRTFKSIDLKSRAIKPGILFRYGYLTYLSDGRFWCFSKAIWLTEVIFSNYRHSFLSFRFEFYLLEQVKTSIFSFFSPFTDLLTPKLLKLPRPG